MYKRQSGFQHQVQSSYENQQEASLVTALLARLVMSCSRQVSGAGQSGVGGAVASTVRVGVITPYKGQVRRIQRDVKEQRRLMGGGAEDVGVNVEVGGQPCHFFCDDLPWACSVLWNVCVVWRFRTRLVGCLRGPGLFSTRLEGRFRSV